MSKNSHGPFSIEFLESLKHPTPFFVFSKEKIISSFNEFRECFPGAEINYAMKANSEKELLETLRDVGCGFEVASQYELEILKEMKADPRKIIYGTSVKPLAHIKEFYDYGVDKYAFDSFGELEKIAQSAPGSSVIIRIVVNDAGSVFRFSEKFGTHRSNALPLLLKAKELGLKHYGISFHVGSQANNKMAWANALEDIRGVLVDLEKAGIKLDIINLGGGFPCNKYMSYEEDFDLKEIAKLTLEVYKKFPYKTELLLEPGRAMVAESAVAIASVIAKVEREEYTWLFLDLGVYNGLFEVMAYQGSTRYKVTALKPFNNSGEKNFALAGPTGDSPDIIAKEVLLPTDIDVGDKLVIHDVGAYSLVAASRFNGFPKPPVYFV